VTSPDVLQVLALIARVVGAWYLFNGAVALNVWRRTMLGSKPANGVEHVRAWTVLAVANLTLLGGLLLLFLSPLAPHIFLASCAAQGAYFAWARQALPPRDEVGRRARATSFNGFLVYVGVTLFTLGCREVGLLA
jgi:hypothetical protein